MNTEDHDEKMQVLSHLLRRPGIFKRCYKKIGQSRFFEDYPYMAVIFDMSVEYFEYCKQEGMLPWEVLESKLPTALREQGMKAGEATMKKLKSIYDRPTDDPSWYDEFVKKLIKEHIALYNKKLLSKRLAETDDPDELQEIVTESKRAMEVDIFLQPIDRNPFDDLEGNMKMANLMPWHVNYLDHILGGGSAKGEMVGILLPSGGGKTTMALQILAASVMRKEHCVYMSSEQDLGGDMTNRMICLGAGIGRSDIKAGFDNLSPEVLDLILKIKDDWKKYCHFYEWAHKPVENLDTLFDVVRDLKAKGIHPTKIVWDWWGRFRTAMIMALGSKQSETAIRRYSQNWLHEMRNTAGTLGMRSVVFHQLAGSEAKKSSGHKPSSHSAQEDTNFNNMFDFCFTGGQKDEDGVVKFTADKARTTANAGTLLHLNGDLCKFQYAFDPNDVANDMIGDDDDDVFDAPRDTGGMMGEV